jgi:hypothetical protein
MKAKAMMSKVYMIQRFMVYDALELAMLYELVGNRRALGAPPEIS